MTVSTELLAGIADIRDRLTRVEERLDASLVRLVDHDHFINGNGKPGAKAELLRLITQVKTGAWIGAVLAGALLYRLVELWFN